MKRNYISPEVIYIPTNGTFDMEEKRSFMGSKMMDIEDVVYIRNQSIKYYQQQNGEQIDLVSETGTPPVVWSANSEKISQHTIQIDPSQSNEKKDLNAGYIITINLKEILYNYIFAELKSNRTFEGILNTQTRFGKINLAINDYISKNIYDRYRFSSLKFYLKSNSISQDKSYNTLTKEEKKKRSRVIPSAPDQYIETIWKFIFQSPPLMEQLKNAVSKISINIDTNDAWKKTTIDYLEGFQISVQEMNSYTGMLLDSIGNQSPIFKFLIGATPPPGSSPQIRSGKELINAIVLLGKKINIDIFPQSVIDYYVVETNTIITQSPDTSNTPLQFVNTWNNNIGDNKNLFTKVITETNYDGSRLVVKFDQPLMSKEYNFEYYFDLEFSKKSIVVGGSPETVDSKTIDTGISIVNETIVELKTLISKIENKRSTGSYSNLLFTTADKIITNDKLKNILQKVSKDVNKNNPPPDQRNRLLSNTLLIYINNELGIIEKNTKIYGDSYIRKGLFSDNVVLNLDTMNILLDRKRTVKKAYNNPYFNPILDGDTLLLIEKIFN